MRRVIFALVIALALGGQVTVVHAEAPSGPHLAFIRVTESLPTSGDVNIDDLFKVNLLTSGPLGELPQTVFGSAINSPVVPVSGPSWSPDASTLAVGGAPGFFQTHQLGDIYLLGTDGTGLRQLTHVGDAADPVFSADGNSIFFARGHVATHAATTITSNTTTTNETTIITRASLWQIGTDGTGLKELLPARKGIFDIPLSVSPVTGDLAYANLVCHRRKCRASVRLFSQSARTDITLVARAYEAVFSPDGQELAITSPRAHNWSKDPARHHQFAPAAELYVLDLATGDLRRLTHTRGVGEATPSWDPSGQRIAYIRSDPRGGARLMEVNADGSCRTRLFERPRSYYNPYIQGVAWEPGAGHEAGRIAC
jgi:dipeptidyl aminopeptidase/acylaminoacyl peptidase